MTFLTYDHHPNHQKHELGVAKTIKSLKERRLYDPSPMDELYFRDDYS